ncbi:glycosyltransferase family 2 protein [Sphingomonas sp.]|uniref:glycosyltransferase family 2 protein n=1 Tax=Sphingomonas sp. TaxID=28214 RepID=UPI003B3AF385
MTTFDVHLYALVWNERPLLPFFLDHYRPFVTKFFLYDDGSDDGSFEYLSDQPDVELHRFDSTGDSFVEQARIFYCHRWKASRSAAAYVIVVNIDELVYHPQPLAALQKAKRDGLTILPTRGWEMIGEGLPEAAPIVKSIGCGVPSRAESKIAIFDPDAVTEINYGPGRHRAQPLGRIVRPARPLFDLLHYKYLSADYVVRRYRELGARMRKGDIQAQLGVQYRKGEADLRAEHQRLLAAAAPVLRADMIASGLLHEPRPGVSVAQLRQVANDKGSLREVWRDDNPFGVAAAQAYITTTPPQVIKAWYKHRRQTDQITAVSGNGRLVVWDVRSPQPDTPVEILLESERPTLITIPPGCWHGFQAIGEAPLTLLHLNDAAFDHVRTDEVRLPADDPSIPFRWDIPG